MATETYADGLWQGGGFVGSPDGGWKSDDYKILVLKNRIGRHERHGKAGHKRTMIDELTRTIEGSVCGVDGRAKRTGEYTVVWAECSSAYRD